MIELKITGNSAEDLKRDLEALVATLGGNGSVEPKPKTPKKGANGGEQPAGAAATSEEPAASTTNNAAGSDITIDTLRDAWNAKKDKGAHSSKLKEVLVKNGLEKLTLAAPEQYAALLVDLNAIEP